MLEIRPNGRNLWKMKIFGPSGIEEIEALVDTGATFTKIPIALGEKVGLKVRRKIELRLSDQRVVERGLCYAEAELDGIRDLIHVTLGGHDESPLIGYTALEILSFKINPITGKLETTTPIEFGELPIFPNRTT